MKKKNIATNKTLSISKYYKLKIMRYKLLIFFVYNNIYNNLYIF